MVSLVRCAVGGCLNRVRQGLRRFGRAADGAELADGIHCAPCRRRFAVGDPAAAAARQQEKRRLDAAAQEREARAAAVATCKRCGVRRDRHGTGKCARFVP